MSSLRLTSLPRAALLAALAAPTALAGPAPTLLRLEPEPFERPSAIVRSTERCVALLKTRDLAAAADACESAVTLAEHERASAWGAPFVATAYDEALAVAYNNRAVLNLLSGRLTLASADATRARHAAPLPGIAATAAVIGRERARAAAGSP